MISLYLNREPIIVLKEDITYNDILSSIHHHLGLDVLDYYLLYNGKILKPDTEVRQESIEIVLRTYGGKGGFGSMLRAIGAQIEKTTNREACRDLSGRRLRDINEEKRLKKWITQQSERGKEAAERKQKKLERLCETPRHKFEDKNYDNERSQLPEMIENAVTQGLSATCSTDTNKRKNVDETTKNKKKPKLWIDADVDISSGDSDVSDDSDEVSHKSAGASSSDGTNHCFLNIEEKHHVLKEDTNDSEKDDMKSVENAIHNISNFQEKKEIEIQS